MYIIFFVYKIYIFGKSMAKEMNSWMHAVQVWRSIRQAAGQPIKLPKKGTKDYDEIVSIKNKIEKGDINPSDHTYSRRTIPTRRSIRPKSPKPSTYRVGQPSINAQALKHQQLEKKIIEKNLVKVEKEKEKLQEKIDNKSEQIQGKIIKLLAKLDKGKMSAAEAKEAHNELVDLQNQIAHINEDANREKKRIEEEKKIQELKQEAVELSEAADMVTEAVSQSSDLVGLTRKLNSHEAVAITKIRKALQTGKAPERFKTTKAPDHIRKLAATGVIFGTPSKAEAERLTAQTGVSGFFAYQDSDGKVQVVGDPPPVVPVVTPEASSSSSSSPTVTIEEVAPVIASLIEGTTGEPVTADPGDVAAVLSELGEPGISEIGTDSGSGMLAGSSPSILPGSRDTDPTRKPFATASPPVSASKIKKAIRDSNRGEPLKPGSRNTGIIGLGGGLVLNLNKDRTNPEALKIAQQIKEENARLKQLQKEGVRLIISRPGQTVTH